MGYFKLFKSEKNNQFYFNLKAGNHETILQSEGYTTKASAINGIESVQTAHSTHSATKAFQH